jgi:hypothetical protein
MTASDPILQSGFFVRPDSGLLPFFYDFFISLKSPVFTGLLKLICLTIFTIPFHGTQPKQVWVTDNQGLPLTQIK